MNHSYGSFAVLFGFLNRFPGQSSLCYNNNNNDNPICKAPECQKTSVALVHVTDKLSRAVAELSQLIVQILDPLHF